MTKKTTYDIVNERILAALENGVAPWKKPWNAAGGRPRSLASKKPYRGSNVFMLSIIAFFEGYSSPWWGTFNAINKGGGKIIKGQHSVPISFYKRIDSKPTQEDIANDITPRPFWIHQWFKVWNTDQTTGLELPKLGKDREEVTVIEQAEEVITNYLKREEINVNKSGRAAYDPGTDQIYMPAQKTFYTDEGYYSTFAHEIGHSTGHKGRLNRSQDNVFGDHAYSLEELVAEFTAAMVCFECGLDEEIDQSAAYIENWLGKLKENKKWIVSAGSEAQKAFDLIWKEN